MHIEYDTRNNCESTIEIFGDIDIEEIIMHYHILTFRFMQALTEATGMTLKEAKDLCTMDDEQLAIILQTEMKLGLKKLLEESED